MTANHRHTDPALAAFNAWKAARDLLIAFEDSGADMYSPTMRRLEDNRAAAEDRLVGSVASTVAGLDGQVRYVKAIKLGNGDDFGEFGERLRRNIGLGAAAIFGMED